MTLHETPTYVRNQRAKLAYDTFAYRAGQSVAWEHLPNTQQVAWKEVVQFLEDEVWEEARWETPICDECYLQGIDTKLVCPKCDQVTSEAPTKTAVEGGAR
jgi:hypothetical protein